MLMADPGTARERVLEVLGSAGDLRRDPALEDRYWLSTPHGEACVNIGTKDPVESIAVEVGETDPPLLEAVTVRALELAAELEMTVSDVQFGHEVSRTALPEMRRFWATMNEEPVAATTGSSKPWWRFW